MYKKYQCKIALPVVDLLKLEMKMSAYFYELDSPLICGVMNSDPWINCMFRWLRGVVFAVAYVFFHLKTQA